MFTKAIWSTWPTFGQWIPEQNDPNPNKMIGSTYKWTLNNSSILKACPSFVLSTVKLLYRIYNHHVSSLSSWIYRLFISINSVVSYCNNLLIILLSLFSNPSSNLQFQIAMLHLRLFVAISNSPFLDCVVKFETQTDAFGF